MATTVGQAFSDFASNLEITDRQAVLVSRRRSNVVAALARSLQLHAEKSKLIGSYDRHTMARYLSEGDVDVMVVLSYDKNPDWYTPDGATRALDRFRTILQDAYPRTPMRRDRNCISMSFSEFALDVVPAFKNQTGYYEIPDSVRHAWLPTDPFAFAQRITEVNQQMGGSLVPLIKMVKGWDREVGWPVRSFHLECLMLHRYTTYTSGYSYPIMLKWLFAALPAVLSQVCYDPVMGDRVDSYLDNEAQTTRRQIAIANAEAAAKRSDEAYQLHTDDPAAAISKWKSVLGEFFPSYG